jgi:hypothetical protein
LPPASIRRRHRCCSRGRPPGTSSPTPHSSRGPPLAPAWPAAVEGAPQSLSAHPP